MLIKFKCANYLSFKDEAVLDMTTVDSYEEHKETHIINETGRDGLRLLKSVAIYGSNGGGKSNFISAMKFMKDAISRSFKDSLDTNRESLNIYHRLSTKTVNKPSTFEATFLIEGIIYRYGFSLFNYEVISEWLYRTDKREVELFQRTGKDFKINESGFPEGVDTSSVNPNVLFVSYLAQINRPISTSIFRWFNFFNIMNGLEDSYLTSHTKSLLESDPNFREWSKVALQFLEIRGVEVDGDRIVAIHDKFDENNFINDQVKFTIDSDESHGTRKLIYFLGGLYASLLNGTPFVIDEFDSKLHPNLTRKLVEFFHKYNVNKCQFIITAHDPILLDKDMYRRDQIWFIDKDQYGGSELYPMSNFKAAADGLRNTSDFRKMYLNCHFGAAESIEISDKLISLIQ